MAYRWPVTDRLVQPGW